MIIVLDDNDGLAGAIAQQASVDDDRYNWFYLDLDTLEAFTEQDRVYYMGIPMEIDEGYLRFALEKVEYCDEDEVLESLDDALSAYQHIMKFRFKTIKRLIEDSTIAVAGFYELRDGELIMGNLLMHGKALERMRKIVDSGGGKDHTEGITCRDKRVRFFSIEGVYDGLVEIFSTNWAEVRQVLDVYKNAGIEIVFDHIRVNIEDTALADMLISKL
jgi:hypothetical protein